MKLTMLQVLLLVFLDQIFDCLYIICKHHKFLITTYLNTIIMTFGQVYFRTIDFFFFFINLGHTLSWGVGGVSGLLTRCSDSDPNHFGPIDPTIEENYNFVGTLLTEVNELFQDEYLHIGGDEVEISWKCWWVWYF